MMIMVTTDLCAVDGCDRPRKMIKATGKRYRLCRAHRHRLDRTGDVRADKPVSRVKGPDQEVTYVYAHKRIRSVRGQASNYDCIDCGQPAEEWSYNGSAEHEFSGVINRSGSALRWSGDPADYEPRCVPCHRTHDVNTRVLVTT